MKVIQSIEAIFEDQKEINQKLKTKVDDIFKRIKKNTWHYFSRVKNLESFALKLETGRFTKPNSLEDFFACTLVVENLDQINKATAMIRRNFEIVSQKPKNSRFTHKEPFSFQFDDLRIYAKIKQAEFLPVEPVNKILFEIQIKTFLQHAWGLATHDLIYKSDEINWPKERIAYQIKAMLEQAEVAISGVSNLTSLPEVLKDNFETTEQKKILKLYKDHFQIEDLPVDLVRLCKNTQELIMALNIKVSGLRTMLEAENVLGRGTNLKNLSPYLLIIQTIINQRTDLIETYLKSDLEKKFKIILPKELQFGKMVIDDKSKNLIRL